MSLHAGELTNGEHVTLHVFLKAARLNGTILLRGMAWAESTDAVYYHDYHAECVPRHQRSVSACGDASRHGLTGSAPDGSTRLFGTEPVHAQVPAAAGHHRE